MLLLRAALIRLVQRKAKRAIPICSIHSTHGFVSKDASLRQNMDLSVQESDPENGFGVPFASHYNHHIRGPNSKKTTTTSCSVASRQWTGPRVPRKAGSRHGRFDRTSRGVAKGPRQGAPAMFHLCWDRDADGRELHFAPPFRNPGFRFDSLPTSNDFKHGVKVVGNGFRPAVGYS